MKKQNRSGDNLPKDLNSPDLMEQTRVHLDEAARLGRELVRRATSAAYPILASDNHDKALRQENERLSQVCDIVLDDFMQCLPRQKSKRTRDYSGHYGDRKEVLPMETETLEDAVILRSVLWGYDSSYYYLVGRRQIRSDDDSFDAIDEVLLYPADPQDVVRFVQVSARKLDLLEELAIEELKKPINTREVLKEFLLHNGGFQVPSPVKWFDDNNYRTGSRLMMSKRRDPDREKDKLARKGLPHYRSSRAYPYGRINRQIYDGFNVPFYALKLATTLSKSEAYDATIARISLPQ